MAEDFTGDVLGVSNASSVLSELLLRHATRWLFGVNLWGFVDREPAPPPQHHHNHHYHHHHHQQTNNYALRSGSRTEAAVSADATLRALPRHR